MADVSTLSSTDINSLISNASSLASQAATAATSSTAGQQVKTSLTTTSNQIQGLVNQVLSGSGLITQQQYDELDAQMAQAKLSLLQAQSTATNNNFALIAGVIIVSGAFLWYITRTKTA